MEPIARKQRPTWRCTHCDTTSGVRDVDLKSRTCSEQAGRDCPGHFYSTQEADWSHCPVCAGTGYSIDAAHCERCHGIGWLAHNSIANPGLPAKLWAVLGGGLWHATSAQALTSILADRCIRLMGATRYPQSFSRQLGCICVFDFGPTASDEEGSDFQTWADWFAGQIPGRCSIWLQIDRGSVAEAVMDPPAVRAAFWSEVELRKSAGKQHEPWAGQFIPFVEAAHRGPIPSSAILGAVIIDRHDQVRFSYHKGVAGLIEAVQAFELRLPSPPEPNPL